MADSTLYTSPEWRALRELALERDDSRCTVSRLLGGKCSGTLHVHHIIPVEAGGPPLDLDNTGTACAHHHPRWEALRRQLARTVDLRVLCPECSLRFRTVYAVAAHRTNVHGVDVPAADRALNLRMAGALLDRLRGAVADRQAGLAP